MMKNAIILILVFAAGVCCGMWNWSRNCPISHANDTLSVRIDTVTYCTREVRIDAAIYRFPQFVLIKGLPDTIYVNRDTILAREQLEYRDSTYQAWVSGYQARLDSIRTFSHNITTRDTTIIERTITAIKEPKRKRFKIGIQGGYYMTPKGLQPGIGAGISVYL